MDRVELERSDRNEKADPIDIDQIDPLRAFGLFFSSAPIVSTLFVSLTILGLLLSFNGVASVKWGRFSC